MCHLTCVSTAVVFHAGPSKQMNWFTNLNGQGAQKSAGTRGPTAMNGCAVMYAAEKGKILTVGGAPTFSKGDNARKGAEVITLGGSAGSNASVKKVAGPIKPRTYSMAVVLPTGHVMHFGGAAKAVEFSDDTAILDAGNALSMFQFMCLVWLDCTMARYLRESRALPILPMADVMLRQCRFIR